jgi:uncharacterized protein (TIGR02145 family)
MRKIFTLIIMVLAVYNLFAQAPQRMTYQAVVRNSANVLIANQNVSARISILQGSAQGAAVYVEQHNTTTNANGLMTVEIGGGSPMAGVFANIDWSTGPYFLKSEIDPEGGINYSIESVQQLLSVPYALYAKEAGNGFSGDYNDLTNVPTFTESQILSISHDTIYLTGGSFVKLPAGFDGDYNSLTNKPNLFSGAYNDLTGKPNLAPVATSGAYGDLTGQPTIPAEQVNADWIATSGKAQILNKPMLFSGNYNDLTNKPTLFDGNYNSLSNKPILFSGNYNDLTNKPTLFDGNYNSLSNRPNLSAVALSGSYNDLINKPALFDGNYNSLSNRPNLAPVATSGSYADLTNKPNLATVATSGSYNDLSNRPAIPSEQVNADWTAISGKAQILNRPNLAPVATSGNYNDLTNKPTIPAEQVNSDWNATSGKAQILNRPNLAPVATTGNYSDLNGRPNLAPVATSGNYNDLNNLPTIPNVPTDVSVFTNDAGYLTRDSLPTNVSGFTNDAGYLTTFTESQILSISNDTIYLTGGSFVKLPAGFDGDYNSLTNKPNLFSGAYGDLTGKPNLAPVATSGNYNDLTNKPTIPTVPTDVSVFNNDAGYLTRDSLPTNVSGFTNDAGYLTSFTESQILSISNDTIYLTGGSFVKLPAGFDGDYNSLTNKPNFAPVATSGNYSELNGKPNLAPVATTGNYSDLNDLPTIPTVPTDVSVFNNDAGYLTRDSLPTNVSVFTNDAGYLTSFTESQILSISNDTIYLTGGSFVKLPAGFDGDYNSLTNKPNLAPVATTGNYNDLNDLPTIPNVPTNVSAFNNDAGYLTSFTESQILSISNDTIYLTGGSFVKLPAGFDGDYNSLTNRPNLAPVATSGNYSDLNGKPNLAPVATTGNYSDLNDLPTIPNVPTDVSAFNNDAGYLTRDSLPTSVSAFTNDAGYLTSFTESQILSISNDTIYLTGGSFVKLPTAEGFSGSYNDLTDKPTIPNVPTNVSAFTNDAGYLTSFTESQILSISNDTIFLTGGSFVKLPAGFDGDYNSLTNKPNLAPVATSGNYSDLNGKPNLAPVATSGNYNDLNDLPTIPNVPTDVSVFNNDAGYITAADVPAQVNSDWNATSGVEEILNKPTNVSAFNNDAGYLTADSLANLNNQLDALQHAFDSLQQIVENDHFVCGTSTVSDHEGNVYHTVKIGNQCWTKENLRTTTSPSTGTYLIPAPGTDYTYTGKQARWYNDDSTTYAPMNYGLLYNWNAAVDTFNTAYGETSVNTSQSNAVSVNFIGNRRGICPAGWHLPSDADWNTMEATVSGSNWQASYETTYGWRGTHAGKLAGGENWSTSSTSGVPGDYSNADRNATGFSAVPAGYCYSSSFYDAGYTANFWSSTQYVSSPNFAYVRYLNYSYANVSREYYLKHYGFSVRCLRDNTTISEQIDAQQHILDSLAPVAFSGDYNDLVNTPPIPAAQVNSDWNATSGVEEILNKPTNVSAFNNDAGYLTADSVAKLNNQLDSLQQALENLQQQMPFICGTSTVSDHEGNIYHTVKIGNQCWTKENLRTTTSPTTGTYLIPDANATYTYTGKQARWYNNDSTTYAPMNYGLLYNWNAAVDTFNTAYGETSVNTDYDNALLVNFSSHRRGICPAGWHLPSDAEWTQLTDYVSTQSLYVCGDTNINIAKALANSTGWHTHNNNCAVGNDPSANNATGFSALPAGDYIGFYDNAHGYTFFWSSTHPSGSSAYSRSAAYGCSLAYVSAYVGMSTSSKYKGISVRCLRNNTFISEQIEAQQSVLDSLAPVAFSGDYNDLVNTPPIPAAQVNSNWNATFGVEEILNKPTNVSAFNNDAEYITQTQLNAANYVTNNGTNCGNAVDLCSLLSRLDSLEYRLQNMPTSNNNSAYGVPLNDTCPQRMVMINGSRNACYHGSTEDNVFFTVLVDGSAVYDASYTWYVNGQHINEYNGFLNFYSGMWGPTYNNPYVFTAKVTMTDGCSYLSGPFEVNVYELPDVIVTGSDSVVCEGESVTLRAGLRTPGNPMITYQWYENTVSSDNALPGRTHEDEMFKPALGTTDYIVIVTHLMEDYGCLSLDTFRVRVAECDTAGGTNNPQTALPTVTTDSVMVISSTSANCYGNVAAEGCTAVTARGVCWSTLHNPTINDSHTADSVGIGSFISILTDLVAGTTYYVRAYATNREGTAYGEETTFTLYLVVPKSGTDNHTMTGNTVTVYDHAGPDANYDNRCWGTLVITAPDSNMLLSISGSYDTYNYYAAQDDHLIIYNGFGTTELIATLRGSGNISNPFFTTQNTVMLRFTSSSYSSTKSGFELFITAIPMNEVPTVTTDTVFNITDSSATCSGNITVNGGVEITAYGVCWGSSHNPTIDGSHTSYSSGTGGFANDITALSANSTYYVRAYATCQHGTIYGNEVSFKTSYGSNGDAQPCQGSHTISDIDGNVYTTVQIGNQCWLAENLRTTRYSDGTPVALGDTLNVVTPYRYAPDFNINYVPEYGYLYNWPAVMHGSSSSISNPSGVQGICPTGWHVPSDSEWTQLTDYLRGPAAYFCNNNNNIAKALTSNTGWHTSIYDCTAGNDMESNNATGFGALPAGHFQGGSYMSFSDEANMWSSSEASNNNVWYRSIASNFAYVRRYSGTKSYGYSVRCLRDIASLSAFPVVTTNTVSEIAEITATCGGSVTSNGAIVTARGVCWSTSPNPTIADSHTTDGNGAGSFTSSLTELLRYNTYYVRAYATTDNGTVYGEEFKFTASIYLNGDEFSCSGTPTVTDVEGNIYNTVQIGGQCWMRENLKTTKYADNTLIEVPIYPHASTTTAYRKSPNGKHSNAPTYGYLYNWRAVMHNSSSSTSNPSGVQGVCPTGWHVPSDAEWTQLTEYVKSQSLYCGNSTFSVAKALAAVQDWYNSTDTCAVGNNPNENNVTGFWALPAGSYYSDDGYYSSSYYSFATDACFWSATEGSSSSAYNRCLYYNDKNINRSNESKCNYFSVRCLRDSASSGNNATTQAALPTITTDSVTAITATTVVCGGDVTAEGSEVVTERGVCWGTAHNPTVCGNHTAEGDGAGHFTVNISGLRTGTTYYVRAYAINNVGTAYGEEVSFKTLRDTVGNGLPCPGIPTVADIDGNIYNTVKFLGKCWMKENLKTTRYADGTFIESGDSFSRETPYRYAPDNDTNNIATYGYLYNWPAVMNGSVSNIASPNGVQGICPNGWHVPNYEELYCIPGPFTESGMCSDENDDAFDDEYYQQVGNYACFWCSEQRDYLEAFFLGITNYASTIGRIKWKSTGMSVRCVLNEEVATILPTVSTITANNLTSTSATCGGNVTSDGGATVTARGVCWSTSQNPTISGNHTTNGSGTGSFTSSLTGLSANTTYYVRAYATNSVGTAYGNEVSFTTTNMDGQSCPGAPTVTDIDGNTYNTVRIGEQCWMKENLRATHYADGSSIPAGGNVASNINPYYYNFSSSTIALDQRGLLYNWQAVMNGAPSSTTNPSGVQGICPMGWHVPSEAEWNQLTDYVSSQSQYKCDNYSSYIAKALASSTSWENNSYNCTVGNDLSTNNATGFSAVPASWRNSQGFIAACANAYFWSSSAADSNTAWYRELKHQSAYVWRESVSCFVGFSVRCLRD